MGCVVRSLVTTKCPTKTTPPAEPTTPNNPEPTNPSDQPSQPSGGGTSSGGGTTNTSGAKAPAPLKIDEKKLTNLPEVKELSPETIEGNAGYTANVLPAIRGYEGEPRVLGAVDMAGIQPTDQGWRIAGVLWYWWLLVLGAVVGSAFLVKFTLLKSLFPVAKP